MAWMFHSCTTIHGTARLLRPIDPSHPSQPACVPAGGAVPRFPPLSARPSASLPSPPSFYPGALISNADLIAYCAAAALGSPLTTYQVRETLPRRGEECSSLVCGAMQAGAGVWILASIHAGVHLWIAWGSTRGMCVCVCGWHPGSAPVGMDGWPGYGPVARTFRI